MEVFGFTKPDMSIDSCSLIKPAFILLSINPHNDDILLIEIDKISEIIRNAHVPAFVVAQVETVDPDLCITEDPIEPDGKSFIMIRTAH